MSTFRIDAQNNITAFGSTEQIEGSGGETFSNQQELAAIAEKWPAARLVDIWNSLPGCGARAAVHQSAGGPHPNLEQHSGPGLPR